MFNSESNVIITNIGVEILTNSFRGRMSSKKGLLKCDVLSLYSV